MFPGLCVGRRACRADPPIGVPLSGCRAHTAGHYLNFSRNRDESDGAAHAGSLDAFPGNEDHRHIFDVAIIGAGFAGLSAALLLGRYLLPTVIFDGGKTRNFMTS